MDTHFDPGNPIAAALSAYNPLADVRIDTEADVADAQNIATILANPEGKGLKDHLDKTARSFLAAAILHACYVAQRENCGPAAMRQVVEFLSMGDLDEKLEDMRTYLHHTDGFAHAMIAQQASVMLQIKMEERAQT